MKRIFLVIICAMSVFILTILTAGCERGITNEPVIVPEDSEGSAIVTPPNGEAPPNDEEETTPPQVEDPPEPETPPEPIGPQPPYVYGNTSGNITNGGGAAVQGDWIYYRSNDDGKIYAIKTDGSGLRKVNDDDSADINIVGDWLYYTNLNIDERSTIYAIKTDGSGRRKITDDRSYCVNVVNDWIYYSNMSDGYKMYAIKTDGSGRQMITDHRSYNLTVVGDWIYYESGFIYAIKTDGTEQRKLTDVATAPRFVTVSDDWIFFCESGSLYTMKTDGSERKKLTDHMDTYITYINVVGDRIYYCNNDDIVACTYSMKIDGSERIKLNNDETHDINVAGDWIFYINSNPGDDSGKFAMKTDGSERHRV